MKNDRQKKIIELVENRCIETQEQLTAMEQLGIDYIQGFYFSKPLPLPEFLAFIKKQECKRTLSISAAVPDPV